MVIVPISDLDKEGYVIEVKIEGVCDLCDESNGVWTRDFGRECGADRTI